MIVRKNQRTSRVVKNVRGGKGELVFDDVMTPETLPDNIVLCSFITVKKGTGAGQHAHYGESEVFHCISGKGKVYDQGREVDIYPGDTVVTKSGEIHNLVNENDDDFVILAFIIKE